MRLELDDQERRAVGKSLVERKARLIERVGDTTQPHAARRSGLAEIKAIASVLRKLLAANRARVTTEPTSRIYETHDQGSLRSRHHSSMR